MGLDTLFTSHIELGQMSSEKIKVSKQLAHTYKGSLDAIFAEFALVLFIGDESLYNLHKNKWSKLP